MISIKERPIASIIAKLKLRPVKILKNDQRYFIAVCIMEGNKVLLKINPSGKKDRKLAVEALISKRLNKTFGCRNFPRHYAGSGSDGRRCYLVREYIDGPSLGNLFGFEYFHLKDKQLEDLISFLKMRNKIKQAGIPKYKVDSFEKDLKLFRKDWGRRISDGEYLQIMDYYKSSKSLLKGSQTVSQGDLFPHNILVRKGRLYIIDWGEAAVKHFLCDAMVVWLNLWQRPGLQKKLIKSLITGPESRKAAKFLALFYSFRTGSIIISAQGLEENLPHREKAKKAIKAYNGYIKSILNNKFVI